MKELFHLRTDIAFRLHDTGRLGDVLDALYPTPAVCGIPKDEARRFILQHEHQSRKYYSGFVGPISPKAGMILFLAAAPAQPDENSFAPADDAANGKQPEPQQPANRKESQEGQTAAKPAPVVRPRGKAARQTTNMGDVNAYVKKFAKPMPLNQWRKQYAELHTSWFGNSEEVAKGWITTFGPLGFRARGLDASWPDTNFRGFFPKTMLDPNGEPVANLYTVTQVIEGSPAEKYVKEGDLILGIDGHLFKTSQSLDVLYGPYQHQNRRGLDMHAGLLVDKAEATSSCVQRTAQRERSRRRRAGR